MVPLGLVMAEAALKRGDIAVSRSDDGVLVVRLRGAWTLATGIPPVAERATGAKTMQKVPTNSARQRRIMPAVIAYTFGAQHSGPQQACGLTARMNAPITLPSSAAFSSGGSAATSGEQQVVPSRSAKV